MTRTPSLTFAMAGCPLGPKFVARQPEVSIVTNIELFANKNISIADHELLGKFIAISTVHPVTADLIDAVILIRQNDKLRLPDAIIAATALVNGLTLITRNTGDFKNVEGLQMIGPHGL